MFCMDQIQANIPAILVQFSLSVYDNVLYVFLLQECTFMNEVKIGG